MKGLKDKIASENEEIRQIYKQITPTFDPGDRDDDIWPQIDLLQGDPVHRGVAIRNPRFKPFWLRAEGGNWQGLWEKGVFKKWKRSDLLPNDRVFTSLGKYSSLTEPAADTATCPFCAELSYRSTLVANGCDPCSPFHEARVTVTTRKRYGGRCL